MRELLSHILSSIVSKKDFAILIWEKWYLTVVLFTFLKILVEFDIFFFVNCLIVPCLFFFRDGYFPISFIEILHRDSISLVYGVSIM